MSNLESKLTKFESDLSELELLRLRQLRASDSNGRLLVGAASYDESILRHENIPVPTLDEREAINDSLRSKLDQFQKSLSAQETEALLIELSGNVGKMQSSFGKASRFPA